MTRTYASSRGAPALDRVDLLIEQGEFVAIEGPSGSGKSTLLNIIGLVDLPTSGDYQLGSIQVPHLSREEATVVRSDHFAFIFQGFHLLDDRPVRDSVELALLYRGIAVEDRAARADAALAAVGLAGFEDKRANLLSGGERQRVAIARALASDTAIVLADEPTGNLDSETGRRIMDELIALHQRGATVIVVTHDREVAETAHRNIRLKDGRILSDSGPTSAARARNARPPGHAASLRSRHLFSDALASITSKLARTMMLAAAIALGVGLCLATAGIAQTAQAQVSDAFDARLNREVTVRWYPDPFDTPTVTSDVQLLVEQLSSLPGVDAVTVAEDLGGRTLRVTAAREPMTARLIVAYGDFIEAERLSMRWSRGHNSAINADEVVLGSTIAQSLGLGPLDAQPTISIDGVTVRVVGIIDGSPREPDLLTSVIAADASPWAGTVPQAVQAALLTRAGAAQVVAQQAPLVINPFVPDSLETHAPLDPADLRNEVEASVVLTLGIVSAVALLAATAALANSMMLSVTERRFEIGLRRAVGAIPRHIAALIATESGLIGVVGGLAGLTLGLGATLIITAVNGWLPTFDLRLVPLAIVGGVVVGVLSGLLPAARASRVSPQEALRH